MFVLFVCFVVIRRAAQWKRVRGQRLRPDVNLQDGLLCLVPFFLLHLYRSHMIEWVYSQWCTVTLCSFMQTHHQHFSLFWFEGTKRLPSRHEDAAVTGAERERARWLEHLLMNHNIIMLVLTKCVLLQASCWRRRPAAEASWMFIFFISCWV